MKRLAAIVISAIFICVSMFSVSAVNYGFDGSTASRAIYLENLNNGTVVFEKGANERHYPASTTKIMTFIITAENVSDLDNTKVTVKQEAIEGLDPESTVMGLSQHVGEQVSVKDLLYGLMLPSGNDAALALADYVGGSISGFAEKMNAKAAELGCTNTHFTNPHGLYDTEHYTTAHDMALIAKYAMKLPGFMDICNTVSYTPAGFEELHNTNYEGGMYYYPYVKGIKTGYLDEAGKCLVTSADKDGSQYLCVCLGADFSYDENINYAMKDTAALYDWAFENLGEQAVYSPADSLSTVNVKYVRNGKSLAAVPEKAITAFLPNNYDKNKLDVSVTCVNETEAPVKKGDVLGTVSVKYEDLDLGVTNLVAAEDVERDISPFEVFVSEHGVLLIIAAAALVIIIMLIIILIAVHSSRKRRREREQRAGRGRRYRD